MTVSFIHLYHDWKSCREKALLINFKNLNAQIAHLLVTQLQVETFFKTKCFIVSGTHVHSKGKDESTKEDWINLLSVTRMSQVMVFHKYVDILRKLPGKNGQTSSKILMQSIWSLSALFMQTACQFTWCCFSRKFSEIALIYFCFSHLGISQTEKYLQNLEGPLLIFLWSSYQISSNLLCTFDALLMHFQKVHELLAKVHELLLKVHELFESASKVRQKCIRGLNWFGQNFIEIWVGVLPDFVDTPQSDWFPGDWSKNKSMQSQGIFLERSIR